MDQLERKITLSTQRYQTAWKAKVNLAGGDPTKVGWHKLEKNDVCTMYDLEEQSKKDKQKLRGVKRALPVDEEEEEETGQHGTSEVRVAEGEGHRRLSWIWMGADNTDLATDRLLHAGMLVPCVFFFTCTEFVGTQVSESSGVRRMHGYGVGERSATYSRRRCAEPWSPWSSKPSGGRVALRLSSSKKHTRKGYEHMHTSRPRSGGLSKPDSRPCGA